MTTPSLWVYPLLYLPRCPTWTCAISKPYQTHIWPIYGSPPFQKLDFGLCARVFSAVLLPLEPTILFSHSPAVSPSKSRDFRLYEPAIPFFTWSAVSHPTSGHDVTRPIRSLHFCHTVRHYYCQVQTPTSHGPYQIHFRSQVVFKWLSLPYPKILACLIEICRKNSFGHRTTAKKLRTTWYGTWEVRRRNWALCTQVL